MSSPEDAAVDRFRALIRIPTVSRADPADADRDAFARFREELARQYPRVHEALELELVAGDSILLRWPGSGGERPSVLMAHHDVVPADEPGWRHGPFDAVVEDGRIWGRGALDDKGMLAAVLEAVERSLEAGHRPAADVYVFSGADEETGGLGAQAVVRLLTERGIRPGLVLDEGGAVADDAFPGLIGAVAYVGVSEKGMAGIRLVVSKPGGHAATPARDGAVATLARAILRLERHPAPARLTPPVAAMMRALAPLARGAQARLFAHPERYRRLLTRILTRRGGEGEALVRTTRAVTRLTGSAADNVIAERATAVVNARIAIGSTVEQTLEEVRAAIRDPEVRVELMAGGDPTPVSPASGAEWDLLAGAIADTFPGVTVAPYVMLQASDARHFARISDSVYRFLPFDLKLEERKALHAVDERIRVDSWLRGVRFFETLLRRL